jgi:hypothetical protein
VVTSLCRPALSDEAFVAPAAAREIAVDLVVTEAAVKQHLLRLYQKLRIPEGPNRRVRLANEVVALGLVRPLPQPMLPDRPAQAAAPPAQPGTAASPPAPAAAPAAPPPAMPSPAASHQAMPPPAVPRQAIPSRAAPPPPVPAQAASPRADAAPGAITPATW